MGVNLPDESETEKLECRRAMHVQILICFVDVYQNHGVMDAPECPLRARPRASLPLVDIHINERTDELITKYKGNMFRLK